MTRAPLMDWARTECERPRLWVSMLAILLVGACQAHPIPDSSPLLQFGGQVRQRYLYTDDAQDTEVHLEIRADGSVRGIAHRSPESECGSWAPPAGTEGMRGARSLTLFSPRSPGAESLEARSHSDLGNQDFQVPVPEARWESVWISEFLYCQLHNAGLGKSLFLVFEDTEAQVGPV